MITWETLKKKVEDCDEDACLIWQMLSMISTDAGYCRIDLEAIFEELRKETFVIYDLEKK